MKWGREMVPVAITRVHINRDTTYKPEQDQCSHCKNTTHINGHNTGTESTAAEADTHTVIYNTLHTHPAHHSAAQMATYTDS